MMPLWIIPLLSKNAGEFSFVYDKDYNISIRGVYLNGEWAVDIHVKALPYFAWGCNNFHTGFTGSDKQVISHFLMKILNQLSDRNAPNNGLLSIISAVCNNQ